ncbi:hypothetical protein BH20ACT3_BH20ACT3_04230 [soil metagenome]
MSQPVPGVDHDVSAAGRTRLEAAQHDLVVAVEAYERSCAVPLGPGTTMSALDARQLERLQDAVASAEDRLWRLREELLGWSRPSWAPSAALVADWFSDADTIYDDEPDSTDA